MYIKKQTAEEIEYVKMCYIYVSFIYWIVFLVIISSIMVVFFLVGPLPINILYSVKY